MFYEKLQNLDTLRVKWSYEKSTKNLVTKPCGFETRLIKVSEDIKNERIRAWTKLGSACEVGDGAM